jgi:DNA transposition AAA+ family ATPase
MTIAAPEVETSPAFDVSKARVPGDVVNRATADLPDEQRSAIRRLHALYIEQNLTLEEVGELIGMSEGAMSAIFRGKYPASLKNVVEESLKYFDLAERRSQARKLEFIQTKLTKRIWEVCKAAIEFQRIAFVFGDTQIGKTEALLAYARAHNHGSTIYVDVPTGGALTHFLYKLAGKLRIPVSSRKADLRRRIIESFDDRMLLIVDEAHRCIPASGNSTAPLQTIEFVRELFDERKCGVVICGTNVFREEMEGTKGTTNLSLLLRQTKRRRLCSLQLPDRPSQADLNAFAHAYGLAPAEGKAHALQQQMIETEALGMWLTLLRMGAKVAGKREQKLDWSHVLQAAAGLKELEGA